MSRFREYLGRATDVFDTFMKIGKPNNALEEVEEELPEDTDIDTETETDIDTETEEDEYIRRMRKDFHDVLTKGLL